MKTKTEVQRIKRNVNECMAQLNVEYRVLGAWSTKNNMETNH